MAFIFMIMEDEGHFFYEASREACIEKATEAGWTLSEVESSGVWFIPE